MAPEAAAAAALPATAAQAPVAQCLQSKLVYIISDTSARQGRGTYTQAVETFDVALPAGDMPVATASARLAVAVAMVAELASPTGAFGASSSVTSNPSSCTDQKHQKLCIKDPACSKSPRGSLAAPSLQLCNTANII